MKYSLSVFSLLLFLVITGNGQQKLVIAPDYPQRGQRVTIQYNPQSPDAKIPDTVTRMQVEFNYSNLYEMPQQLPMVKKNGIWETSFMVPRYAIRANFIVTSGSFKDERNEGNLPAIVIYDSLKQRVKGGYLYEGYSQALFGKKDTTIPQKQMNLFKEELKHFPDNYEAQLRLLNLQMANALPEEKIKFKRQAEKVIADKFYEKPGVSGHMNLTTMGYLIIGQNNRVDSIREVIKKKYPRSQAGYDLRISDITSGTDTAEAIKKLTALIKEENKGTIDFIKPAHEELFKYYASIKNERAALYHLSKSEKSFTPYQPSNLKKQAELLYKNGIGTQKALELAARSLTMADTFPVGIIRFFPETGYLPSYVSPEVRINSTQAAQGSLHSLIALLNLKTGNKDSADFHLSKALSLSEDDETLANAGEFYTLTHNYERAFETFKRISMRNAEDTLAFQNMEMNYGLWKKNNEGWQAQKDSLNAFWITETKKELSKEMIMLQAPEILSHIVDLQGNSVSPTLFENKIVVLDFWATWCIPCMKEMPYMQKVYDHYKEDTEVVFMIINSGANNSLADAQGWWGNKTYSFPVYYNNDPTIGDKLGFNVIPATFIIDKNYQIRFKTIGFEGAAMERKMKVGIQMIKELKNSKNE